MRTLGRTFSRFEQWLTTSSGVRFRGSIQVAKEGILGLSNFLETRETVHCRLNTPAKIGDVVVDEFGHRFILADHDVTRDMRVFKMFRATSSVSWTRLTTVTEPITGLPKSSVHVNLGPIWCALELYGRTEVDRALHIQMERTRVLSGADLQLNDVVDGRIVRRVYTVYGIAVAEVQ